MKFGKILIAVAILALFWTPFVKADDSKVNLSDAIYADLALKHQLSNVSIFYFDGNTDNNIDINSKRNWIPASTIKLYVAMYAYDQIAKGKVGLQDLVKIKSQNIVPSEIDTPELPYMKLGQTVTIARLLKQMLTQSDNTAYNTLLDIFDRRDVTKYVQDLGLANSSVRSKLNVDDQQILSEYATPGFGNNVTSAGDFATAFVLIRGNRIPGAAALYAILLQQKLNNMIPAQLPKKVTVAHKTGDLAPLYHDGGIIVDANRSYILSVFTNAGSPDVVAHLSQLIYSKNYNLIGKIATKTVGEYPNQTIDPLVFDTNAVLDVLGVSTPSSFLIPEVTAADLGIKDADLTLTTKLPLVIAPVDSPWHILVTSGYKISEAAVLLPSLRSGLKLQEMRQQLAEAEDLLARKKNDLALSTLNQVDTSLTNVVTDSSLIKNTQLQTDAKAISETRFEILHTAFVTDTTTDKTELIKNIARQARDSVEQIEPALPKAVSATSVSQAPIVAKVVKVNNGSITIKTNAGQELNVDTNNDTNTRTSGQDDAASENLSSLQIGSTIAVVGTTNGSEITPAFVLKDLPENLAIPIPATVLKVNDDNKTIVVSQDGKPVQMDLNPDTIIKSTDTNLPLNEVHPGDTIVARGTVEVATPSATPSTIQITAIATAIPTVLPTTVIHPTLVSTVSTKSTLVPTPTPKATSTPSPTVIKVDTIQVVKNNPVAPTATPVANKTAPTSVPQPTQVPVATSVPQPTAQVTPEPTKKK